MVLMHIAYGLDLIALTMGTGLLVWSIQNPGTGSWLGKLFGAIVMIFSIISIVCMLSCAMKGAECHGKTGHGEGMMSETSTSPSTEAGHDHMMKKMEHKK